MTSSERAGRIPLQLTRSCVVASIQVDLDADVLDSFRKELLALLHRSGAQGVILDLAGVEVLDREDFDELRKTMQMASLMGGRCLLAGLRPGVVSALVDLGVDTRGVTAVANLDEAFRLMEDHLAQPSESDGVDECEKDRDEGQEEVEARLAATPQHGHADLPRRHRRHVGLDAVGPPDLHLVGPWFDPEVAAHPEAPIPAARQDHRNRPGERQERYRQGDHVVVREPSCS